MQRGIKSIPAITGLRFFAALLIIFNHTFGLGLFPLQALYNPILAQGVSFFFVLSGFVLAINYRDFAKAGAFRNYYAARIARIYPLYLSVLIISVVLRYIAVGGVAFSREGFANFFSEAFLVQAWLSGANLTMAFNPPGWTISAEALFYVTMPFFVIKKTRKAALLATAVAVALLLAFAQWTGLPLAFDRYSLLHLIAENPIGRLPEFVLGIFLGRLFLSRPHAPRGSVALWTGLELAAVALCYFSSWMSRYLSSYPEPRTIIGAVPAAIIFGSGAAPAFGALIYVFARQAGRLSQAVGNRFWVYLGESSFALYLIHLPLIMSPWFIAPFFDGYAHLTTVQKIGTYLTLTVVLLAVSAALHELIEERFRNRVRRALSPAPAARAAAPKPRHDLDEATAAPVPPRAGRQA